MTPLTKAEFASQAVCVLTNPSHTLHFFPADSAVALLRTFPTLSKSDLHAQFVLPKQCQS